MHALGRVAKYSVPDRALDHSKRDLEVLGPALELL